MEYMGQVSSLALIAGLLTVPLILLNKYLHFHNLSFNGFYLGMIAIVFINEYRRRMKFANIIPQNAGVVFVNILSAAIFITFLIH